MKVYSGGLYLVVGVYEYDDVLMYYMDNKKAADAVFLWRYCVIKGTSKPHKNSAECDT